MYKNTKLINKTKVFDFKRKSIQDVNKFKQIIDDPEVIRIVEKEAPKLAKSYNPIELKID